MQVSWFGGEPLIAKDIVFDVSEHVARRCAERLAPSQLELGGKDAAVVAADAPLERTAHGLVWAAFMNTGQSCASIERVYIVDEVYDRLVRRIVELTETLNVGDPSLPDTDCGPLATAEQRDTVAAQVDDALARGARALTGGEGTYSIELSHYEAVPGNIQKRLMDAFKRAED